MSPFVFLFGCLGTRSLITWLVYRQWHLPLLAAMGALFVLGWLYILLIGRRDTGPEAGGAIWWQHVRPLHALLWATFVGLVVMGNKQDAWKPLAIDTALGFSVWAMHHGMGVKF